MKTDELLIKIKELGRDIHIHEGLNAKKDFYKRLLNWIDKVIKNHKHQDKFVSIDFYNCENLRMEMMGNDIKLTIRGLGEFQIPKDKLFKGIEIIKS